MESPNHSLPHLNYLAISQPCLRPITTTTSLISSPITSPTPFRTATRWTFRNQWVTFIKRNPAVIHTCSNSCLSLHFDWILILIIFKYFPPFYELKKRQASKREAEREVKAMLKDERALDSKFRTIAWEGWGLKLPEVEFSSWERLNARLLPLRLIKPHESFDDL